jgi:hypothetical protein
MSNFPKLNSEHSSTYILEAYSKIANIYDRGTNLLLQEEPDVIHLKIVIKLATEDKYLIKGRGV